MIEHDSSDCNCRTLWSSGFSITSYVIKCNSSNHKCRVFIFGPLLIACTPTQSVHFAINQIAIGLNLEGNSKLFLSSLYIKFTHKNSSSFLSSSKHLKVSQNSYTSVVASLSFLALAYINGPLIILRYSISTLMLVLGGHLYSVVT